MGEYNRENACKGCINEFNRDDCKGCARVYDDFDSFPDEYDSNISEWTYGCKVKK